MPLLNLPNELLLTIASSLSKKHLNNLCQTNHRLNALFTPLLFDLDQESRNSLLLWAKWDRHERLIRYLVETGVDIDIQNETGSTALHIAARSASEAAVKFFVQHGADINAEDIQGRTPLLLSVFGEYKACIKFLLDNRADSTQRLDYRDQLTALHYATGHREVETVRMLLDNGADVNAAGYISHETALHRAAKGGYDEIAGLLLERGADVNSIAEFGETALMSAAWGGGMKELSRSCSTEVQTSIT